MFALARVSSFQINLKSVGVNKIGSSSLLVTLFGGWGCPVHSGPLGVH
jgi:hypothetical protein